MIQTTDLRPQVRQFLSERVGEPRDLVAAVARAEASVRWSGAHRILLSGPAAEEMAAWAAEALDVARDFYKAARRLERMVRF